jgi:Lon-like ATP-dependent protease
MTKTDDLDNLDGDDEDHSSHPLNEYHNEEKEESDHDKKPSASILLMPHRRIDLISVDDVGPPIDVTVSHWDKLTYVKGQDSSRDDTIRALCQEVLSTIREVAQLNTLFKEQVVNLVPSSHMFDMNDPYRLADFAASLSINGGDVADLQSVLEEKDPELRLHKALVLLSKEREVGKLQKEISAKVEEKMSEAQRKYFLTEQLKSIKKELGMEKDDKESLIEKYRKQMAEYIDVPDEINETIESELDKLSTLEKNSSEFNVTRSYLDWLTAIPWGVTTKENFDITEARHVLDRDHYGMDEVKETILQFIAVGKLKGTVQGKILCLAGPPGTGKTSIAESIAAALGRKFFRFSVGGMSDVSEIKGHRRTYVGAMPGKIIQCLKSTGSSNPLVLIDEIDKLGRDFRGDPASALLEVLDPSQNSTFRDHFIDVPVDISKVLFMCTANNLETIPAPLLDRMEVIRLSGCKYFLTYYAYFHRV